MLPYCPNTTEMLVSSLSVCREKSCVEDNHCSLGMAFKMPKFH